MTGTDDRLALVRLHFPRGEHRDVWTHVRWEDADGDYTEEFGWSGHGDRWIDAGCGDAIEEDEVIQWAELPTAGRGLSEAVSGARKAIEAIPVSDATVNRRAIALDQVGELEAELRRAG